jgi:hypothetical protein
VTATTLARRHPVARRAVIAWSIAAACLLVSLASLGVWVAIGIGLQPDALLYVALPVALGGVGALLTTRVPDNPIGPLLLASLVGFTTLIGAESWVLLGTARGTPLPGSTVAALAAGLAFIPSIVVVMVGIPLVFPTGRFLGPRWRWVAVGVVVAVIVAELRPLFGEPLLMEVETLPNPLYRAGLAPILGLLDRVAALAAIPLFALTVASVVIRYRRGDTIARHQLRWLFAVSSVAIVAFSLSFNLPAEARGAAEAVGLFAVASYPLAIGIAVIRYRLFEIDRIISRSISYAVISVVLLTAYAGIVLVLQGPLGGLFGNDAVVVALSTLVVAALFQPLRRRVQRSVDQRFDRARVDSDRTAGAFGTRLRDEVDIDAVLADLSVTVDGALRPTRFQVWLRDPGR